MEKKNNLVARCMVVMLFFVCLVYNFIFLISDLKYIKYKGKVALEIYDIIYAIIDIVALLLIIFVLMINKKIRIICVGTIMMAILNIRYVDVVSLYYLIKMSNTNQIDLKYIRFNWLNYFGQLAYFLTLVFMTIMIIQISSSVSKRKSRGMVTGILHIISIISFVILRFVRIIEEDKVFANIYYASTKLIVLAWPIIYAMAMLSLMLLLMVFNRDSEKSFSKEYCSMLKHILLLLFTCGIWYLIWIYGITDNTNNIKGEEDRNPTTKLLLCIFIPFYVIYWTYKTAQRIDKLGEEKNINSNLSVVCMILAIFIPIIPPILMQDKMNDIVSNVNTICEINNQINITDELEKYKNLLDKGLITQEDYDMKKKEILGM